MSGDPTFFVLPVTHSEEGDLEGWGVMNTALRFKQVQTEQKWYTNYNNLLNSRLPTAAPPLVFIFPPTLERKDSSTPPHLPLPWARDSITSLPTIPQLNLHLISGLSHQHLTAQHVSHNLNRRGVEMLASAKFTVLLNFNLGPWSSFPSLAEGAPNHLGTEWDAYSCVSCGCRNKPAQTWWLERTEIKGPFYAKHGSEHERKQRGYITCLRAHSYKRQYRQPDPELRLVTLRTVHTGWSWQGREWWSEVDGRRQPWREARDAPPRAL